MTYEEFCKLLEKRDELRAQHESLCEECNEACEDLAPPTRLRDRVWAQLQKVEEQIEAELDEERAAEEDKERAAEEDNG